MIKLKLYGDLDKVKPGVENLKETLRFSLSDEGIPLELEYAPNSTELLISFKNGKGYIKYSTQNNFFRQLSRWLAFYNSDESFYKEEKNYFNKTGTMIDVSRNAVLNVKGVKKMLTYMATFGMNQAMMYTEDTYEVEDYPYFGYLRGKYSKAELQELDTFAHTLGIEMIPCIQTLGHLTQVLQYGIHHDIQDTSDILLVGEPKTYDFLENIIKAASSPFRSNRIHIGMDEAFEVGKGRYQQINGHKDTYEIMSEHVKKVVAITEGLGLEPMMWSDMYYRAGSVTDDYYDEEIEVPENVVNDIPEIDMVLWDYYHQDEETYEALLKNHLKLEKKVVFAGGVWTWNGIAPNYGKTIATSKAALSACKKLGVEEVFATMWGDDGGETPIISALPGLQIFADLAYNNQVDTSDRDTVFNYITGISYDDFYLLNALDETPGVNKMNLETSAGSKVLLWQDPLLGRFDKEIKGLNLNSYYSDLAEKLKQVEIPSSFQAFFDFYYQLSNVLSEKADFGVNVKKAYDTNNRKQLVSSLKTAEKLTKDLECLRLAHQEIWMQENKPFGWEVIDIRYGGAIARMKSTAKRLDNFIKGELQNIEELEVDKLNNPLSKDAGIGRGLYREIASTSKLSGV
ncbi:MAG: beta-N-acetylhexosaminidase [Alkalibacterium sp.]|nr:beta-N-acetylhexosaminidase [Tetragenococcus koreensis]MDN6729744.1 beta-N-acetylhexosaminidase [Alkalibacterium sp.]